MEKKTAILYPAEPFDFRLTAENQPYFRRDANAEIDSGGIYQRLLDLENKLILVTAHPENYPENYPRTTRRTTRRTTPRNRPRVELQRPF